ISYSLYLCHWPLIFFWRYVNGEFTALSRLIVACLALAVAFMMYRLIERPFRYSSEPPTPRNVVKLAARCAAVATIVLVPALVALTQGGFGWRLSAEQRELLRMQRFGYAPCDYASHYCVFGDKDGSIAVQVLGDSLAQHWVAGLDRLLVQEKLRGEIYSSGGCPMLIGLPAVSGARGISVECPSVRATAVESLGQSTTPVVIAMAWPLYAAQLPRREADMREALITTLDALGQNRAILLIGVPIAQNCTLSRSLIQPGPLPHAIPASCAPVSSAATRASADAIDRMFSQLQPTRPGLTVLRPVDYFCNKDECPITISGRWLFEDRGHLTIA